jgi:hypothetical protein
MQDAVHDAAVSSFVYKLASIAGGMRSRLSSEMDNDMTTRVNAAEEELVRTLHADPILLASETADDDSVRAMVNLTNVDVKAEIEKLKPEIEHWWFEWEENQSEQRREKKKKPSGIKKPGMTI